MSPPPAVQWAVEQEDAVLAALGDWLKSPAAGLGEVPATNQPAITVLADWPDPSLVLTSPTVAVLRAGAPDVDELSPEAVGDGVPVMGNIFEFPFRVGQATLPLQLDVWATSKPMRGDILKRLTTALRAGKDLTLAAYYASLPPDQQPKLAHDPIADNGIVLQLGAPYSIVLADYSFTTGARLDEGPNAAQSNEWRATLTGEATYDLIEFVRAPKLLDPKLDLTTG